MFLKRFGFYCGLDKRKDCGTEEKRSNIAGITDEIL